MGGHHYGICGFCGERVHVADLIEHLERKHNVGVDLQTWPDGDLVVVDESLVPDDFKES